MDDGDSNTDDHVKTEDKLLIGVNLTSEAYTHDADQDVCLGLLSINLSNTSVSKLRSQICSELRTTPIAFTFLAKQGWPITIQQENSIYVSQILTDEKSIRIQKSYEKPRVGIKTFDNTAIGFVFAEHNSSIKVLRDIIYKQLGYVGSPEGRSYQFIDRNGWPISMQQESSLTLLDTMIGGAVRLLPGEIITNMVLEQSPGHFDAVDYTCEENRSKRMKLQHLRQLTFRTSKDLERSIGSNSDEEIQLQAKQILISYVRAEASQHALGLKQQLTNIGYSVYLDVHEIKSGIDWQDSLNYAVSNCEVFVPLVTSRYGETQWTNREVKLADVLDKQIVPVSFLDNWPPKCLAIQFATTQYIPWKPTDAEEGETDIHHWDPVQISRVAMQIGDRVKNYDQNILDCKTRKATLSRKLSLRSYPAPLPETVSLHLSQEISSDRDGQPLVVIAAHLLQQQFCHNLRAMLEVEGFEVWCSTELEDDSLSGPPLPDNPACSDDLTSALFEPCDCCDDSSVCLSQLSQMSRISQVNEEEDSTRKKKCLRFQQKADEAGVVIFVLSKAFAASKTCQEQVFYCEHRKRVIPLRFEEFCMPGWMSMLIGTGIFEDARAESYQDSLIQRVKRAVDPTGRDGTLGEVNEEKIDSQVRSLRKRLPKEVGVYIAGSTTFFHKNSQNICRAIGKYLAQLDNIQIVTGGFYGVGETVGRTYEEERISANKERHIWHVLPEKDDQDRQQQCWQNKDRTFPLVPYGKTVYSGESVREREIIVSRVFDICILVEGGPGAAHEAEQFVWNDHAVIPVRCTGGAAGGKFNVPEKVFKVPPGVNESDWLLLQDTSVSAEDIGQAVARIVMAVRERLKLDSPTNNPLKSPLLSASVPKVKRKLSRTRSTLTKMKTFVFTQPQLGTHPEEDDNTVPFHAEEG